MAKRKRPDTRRKANIPTPKVAAMPWDHGPRTSAARQDAVIEAGGEVNPDTGKRHNPNNVTRLRRLTVLQVYEGQGRITAVQAHAGARLASAHARPGELGGSDAPKVDKMGSGSDPLAGLVDARREFAEAWRALPMPCRAVVYEVVIEDRRLGLGVEPNGAAVKWQDMKVRMRLLRVGLSALAIHFGYQEGG